MPPVTVWCGHRGIISHISQIGINLIDSNPISKWTTLAKLADDLGPWLTDYATRHNTYYGLGLRDLRSQPSAHRRGGKQSVCAIPGLVFDADDLRGVHKQDALPRHEHETAAFLHTLRWKPSLLVNSGGGVHAYWLFEKPFIITCEAERDDFEGLSNRFRTHIIEQAKERHQWRFDKLSQLDIILRLPGSLNHKSGTPVPVTLLHEGGERYRIDDFRRDLPPLPTQEKRAPRQRKNPRQQSDARSPTGGDIDIMTVARHYGSELTLKSEQSGEWEGSHPVHGSTTGNNFNVQPSQGVWHCFRCDSGGDYLHLIAVCEGFVPCEDAEPGVFKGNQELFRKVVAVANATFGAGIDWKTWIEPEIPDAYEGPEYGDADVEQDESPQEAPSFAPPKDNPWDYRESLKDFLDRKIDMPEGLVSDLAFPGMVSIFAAPAGACKTISGYILLNELAKGGIFRGKKLHPARVLIVDTDNSESTIQSRLSQICENTDLQFEIITRKHAPKLTDQSAWERIPAKEFDVILIDSFGGATPGIGAKDDSRLQKVLKVLTDLADKGPSVIVLENTTKSALSYRGGGEKKERGDIFYEVRDITNWEPSGAKDWWLDIPVGAAEEWQEKATRTTEQKKRRLAWVCGKFRPGEEPMPFAIEIDFSTRPWSLTDITAEIEQAGEKAAQNEKEAHQRRMQDAAYALKKKLSERTDAEPMGKTEAVDFLYSQGLTRKVARTILESHNATVYPNDGMWTLDTIPTDKKKVGVFPLTNVGGKKEGIPNSSKNNPQKTPPSCRTDDTGAARWPPSQRIENTNPAEPGVFAAELGLKKGTGAANMPQTPARASCDQCGRPKEGTGAEAFCLGCDLGHEADDLTSGPKADDELRI